MLLLETLHKMCEDHWALPHRRMGARQPLQTSDTANRMLEGEIETRMPCSRTYSLHGNRSHGWRIVYF